jgi:hypothetical protein
MLDGLFEYCSEPPTGHIYLSSSDSTRFKHGLIAKVATAVFAGLDVVAFDPGDHSRWSRVERFRPDKRGRFGNGRLGVRAEASLASSAQRRSGPVIDACASVDGRHMNEPAGSNLVWR